MDEYKEKWVDQISEIGETRLCCSVNAWMKNQSDVTNGQMSLNYKNSSLIHKFKIIMQITVVVVVVVVVVAAMVVVVNLFILYCVPHTTFIQKSHKMPLKNPIRKLGFILYWKITFILHQNQYVLPSEFHLTIVQSVFYPCAWHMGHTMPITTTVYGLVYIYHTYNHTNWKKKKTLITILTSSFTVIMTSGSKRLKGFVLPAICVNHQQFWNQNIKYLILIIFPQQCIQLQTLPTKIKFQKYINK